ncbi:hypothetical protein [Aliiroseovarius crassostreae]|uniref:hypothetical protein n=1 Tax=Aliiroseovarius crassostreae TaxID=154981 RepID=UPI00220C9D2A|nr:hypothetical protein [Aliiroseovarius crassostreae]UWQ06663.1 hypothetical protein K3X22_15345 [Aliiroseovarius crassostreae]
MKQAQSSAKTDPGGMASSLPFHAALTNAPAPLIAEIKPSSPKVGQLLARRSVADVARDYARAGAPCLSVTTGHWHKGSVEMIEEMACTGLPILRKDFITSVRDLEVSKRAGASAVLLTCKLIRQQDILRLAYHALDQGLTPFVEASCATELEGLQLPQGAILAINNRDIRQQETDDGGIEHSLSLWGTARAQHKGLLISASGLNSPNDVRRARSKGFDGVLIGTALLSDPDLPPFDTTRLYVEASRAPTQM